MNVGKTFDLFLKNLAIDSQATIELRCNTITKRLNSDFWNVDSDSSHRLYAGSFGRGTAIKDFHDVDVVFCLPQSTYDRYDSYMSNGQSALLQAVKTSIQRTYSQTDVGGDGQVVVVSFADGMRVEVLPAFTWGSDYTYPDSNNGGTWKSADPESEIKLLTSIDKGCGGNLVNLCRMARAWRRYWNVDIKGILLDTLACDFLTHSRLGSGSSG